MKLIATRPVRYASRKLPKGAEFEASSRDARLLKAIGKAVDAPVRAAPAAPAAPAPAAPPDLIVPKKPPRVYRRRNLEADPLDHDGDGKKGGSRKSGSEGGRYRRRDMRAED